MKSKFILDRKKLKLLEKWNKYESHFSKYESEQNCRKYVTNPHQMLDLGRDISLRFPHIMFSRKEHLLAC